MFFFISGMNTETKSLGNATNVICPACGAYTCMHITVLYEALHIFFVPVLRWNRRYLVTAPCCQTVFALDPDEGRAFEKNEKATIDPARLHKTYGFSASSDHCPFCGAHLSCDARFCSQCGKSIR
ncbi:hypothetical protein SDC9_155569 [bioreactor metagenome]|uniref:Zinc-ribbon 15 domain-containing protein n=1 Tax=bioreactor metagenome TaxID=1076179 RepID=A0A645F252_9ZZZZ